MLLILQSSPHGYDFCKERSLDCRYPGGAATPRQLPQGKLLLDEKQKPLFFHNSIIAKQQTKYATKLIWEEI